MMLITALAGSLSTKGVLPFLPADFQEGAIIAEGIRLSHVGRRLKEVLESPGEMREPLGAVLIHRVVNDGASVVIQQRARPISHPEFGHCLRNLPGYLPFRGPYLCTLQRSNGERALVYFTFIPDEPGVMGVETDIINPKVTPVSFAAGMAAILS